MNSKEKYRQASVGKSKWKTAPFPQKINNCINDLNMFTITHFHENIVKVTWRASKHYFCFR